jgi:hypothetical protein
MGKSHTNTGARRDKEQTITTSLVMASNRSTAEHVPTGGIRLGLGHRNVGPVEGRNKMEVDAIMLFIRCEPLPRTHVDKHAQEIQGVCLIWSMASCPSHADHQLVQQPKG